VSGWHPSPTPALAGLAAHRRSRPRSRPVGGRGRAAGVQGEPGARADRRSRAGGAGARLA